MEIDGDVDLPLLESGSGLFLRMFAETTPFSTSFVLPKEMSVRTSSISTPQLPRTAMILPQFASSPIIGD